MPKKMTLYLTDEFLEVLAWAKTAYPKKPLNRILFDALHAQRTRSEPPDSPGTETPLTPRETTAAQEYYNRKFGHYKTEFPTDAELIATLGPGKTRDTLARNFDRITIEHPEYLPYCKEHLRQDHPRLYKIWTAQNPPAKTPQHNNTQPCPSEP